MLVNIWRGIPFIAITVLSDNTRGALRIRADRRRVYDKDVYKGHIAADYVRHIGIDPDFDDLDD